jgi:hypothetical protein
MKREFLGAPLFFRNRLLVEVHGDPAIRMPEQLLGCFDVDSFLAQHRSQAMAERMPPDPLLDSDPFQRRPHVTPENHVGRDGLRRTDLRPESL